MRRIFRHKLFTVRKLFFFFLFCHISSLLFAQKTNFLKQIKLLDDQAHELIDNQPDSSISISEKSIQIATQNNLEGATANAYFNIGMANYVKGAYASALYYHIKAFEEAGKFGNIKVKANAQLGLGLIYHEQKKFDVAISSYLNSLELYRQIDDKKGQAHCNDLIGFAFVRSGFHSEALKYLNKALELANQLMDKPLLASISQDLGIYYFTLKDYPKAIQYQNQSLIYSRETGSNYNLCFT